MRKPFRKSVAAMTCLLALSSTAQAMIVWLPLEDRVAASDLIVVGRVINLGDRFGLDDHPQLARGTILVDRVLRGDRALRSVEFLYTMPPGKNKPRVSVGPVQYRVGQEQIWMLKRQATVGGTYAVVYPHQRETVSRSKVVAKVIEASKNPAKALREAAKGSRVKRSAAYLVLREAAPESGLPRKAVDDNGPEGGGKRTVPDTSGHEVLDAALVDLAVTTAIEAFPSMDREVHELARRTLQRVGCPIRGLEPPLPKIRATTVQQTRQFLKSHQKDWARAIRKWWISHRKALKLYVPKKSPQD
ncbi:MAG: hypothetical protein GWP05_03720 [Anaerolineaceae bacterium]|nr:hypothetical protein [Anaerolineaceae bacterium]